MKELENYLKETYYDDYEGSIYIKSVDISTGSYDLLLAYNSIDAMPKLINLFSKLKLFSNFSQFSLISFLLFLKDNAIFNARMNSFYGSSNSIKIDISSQPWKSENNLPGADINIQMMFIVSQKLSKKF